MSYADEHQVVDGVYRVPLSIVNAYIIGDRDIGGALLFPAFGTPRLPFFARRIR